jgi:hypothetical protein
VRLVQKRPVLVVEHDAVRLARSDISNSSPKSLMVSALPKIKNPGTFRA